MQTQPPIQNALQAAAGAVTRRRLLVGCGLAATAWSLKPVRSVGQAAAPDGFRIIHARTGAARLRGPDRPSTPVWGYDGGSPGPLIRARRGEEVKVRLINELDEPTMVHWHGVRLVNAMDGTGLTQAPVAPGSSFDYRFAVPDAGTFWYHASQSAEQASRGLAGALVVDHEVPLDLDHDVVALLQDWPPGAAGAGEPAPDRHVTVNGAPSLAIPVRTNDRLRLRLINAANVIMSLRLDRHRVRVMALDGQPAEPFLARDDRVFLSPGNRVDLFIDATLEPGDSAPLMLATEQGEAPLAHLVYASGAPGRAAARPEPAPLPPNPLPRQMDFRGALKLDSRIADERWSRAGRPEAKPLFSVRRGRTVTLAFTNLTMSVQSLHIHGHHFRLLDRRDDGWKPFWLDSMAVAQQDTVRVALVADNPGRWAIDGRPLDEPEDGMTAWFEVT